MRRFYSPPDAIDRAGEVVLDREESHHLQSVLRLDAGDHVRVFDGVGGEYECEIVSTVTGGARLRVVGQVEPSAPESSLDLHLAAAVYKADKLDLVIQKAVELGVTRFTPFVANFSEVRLKEMQRRSERWNRIAMEATKQCERARVMTVDECVGFDEALTLASPGSSRVIFSEKGGGPLPDETLSSVTALIGPKGGWSDGELTAAEKAGFTSVKLGSRIMKAETAAIAITAVLQHRFGDFR